MSAKQQYSEFLKWLKAKQIELADSYWLQNPAAQKIYRRMLIEIHVEIITTEQLLKAI